MSQMSPVGLCMKHDVSAQTALYSAFDDAMTKRRGQKGCTTVLKQEGILVLASFVWFSNFLRDDGHDYDDEVF